jgi:hypothetical protein
MRLYFHLSSQQREITDREGVEVSDLAHARAEAMQAVQEICAEMWSDANEWSGWKLRVTDADGRELLSIPLCGKDT